MMGPIHFSPPIFAKYYTVPTKNINNIIFSSTLLQQIEDFYFAILINHDTLIWPLFEDK